MKNLLVVFSILVALMAGNLFAQDSLQVQNKKQYRYKNQVKTANGMQSQGVKGQGFVDEDGDGYNDNAVDSDGDGIPNGQDEDYDGAKARKGNNAKGFVDADGDGVNDNALDADGDGIPNGQDDDFVRPQDGSGAKRGGGSGTGDCDGTGNGKGKRGGGRK